MGRAFSFLALLTALAVGAWFYSRQVAGVTPAGNARAAVDVVGVRNDLLALANAERRYLASQGKYGSIEELISSGEISMPSTTRGLYTYTAEYSDDSFIISAVCSTEPPAGVPRALRIDNTMHIHSE